MLAVRNYGHFWNRELVSWGQRGKGNSGSLRGYVIKDRHPRVVDFREQIGIYLLFTANREAIYVGQAGAGKQRLFLRLRQHTQDHLRDRWGFFSWFGLRDVNETNNCLSEHQKPNSQYSATNAAALNEIEAVLIQILESRLNKQGARWGESKEFFQYVESDWEDVEIDVSPDMLRILSEIEELKKSMAGR